jgi:tetratricopeptide (TPR) repeat protein
MPHYLFKYRYINPLLLAIFLFFPSGCVQPQKQTLLPPEVGVGQFEGPGGEILSQTLSSRQSAHPRQGPSLILSGQTVFRFQTGKNTENLSLKEEGPLKLTKEKDQLTGREFEVEIPQILEVKASFDYTSILAQMDLEWTLSSLADQQKINSGHTSEILNKSSGGYLAQKGLTSKTALSEPEAIKILATALADQIIQEIGPAFTALSLSPASDALSKEARLLAEKNLWSEAALIWQQLLKQNPDYAPALYNLGLYHERSASPDEAWNYYRLAYLSKNSNLHREALTRLTDLLNRLGRPPRPGQNPFKN